MPTNGTSTTSAVAVLILNRRVRVNQCFSAGTNDIVFTEAEWVLRASTFSFLKPHSQGHTKRIMIGPE